MLYSWFKIIQIQIKLTVMYSYVSVHIRTVHLDIM